MRHLDYDSLKKLIKVTDEIVLSDVQELFDVKTFKKPECDSCSHTFTKCKLFDKTSYATKEEKLIHVDLIYSIRSTEYNEFKDYMSITDDYDETVSVHLFKNKLEMIIKLQRFCEYQKSHEKSVLAIDNDVESVIKRTEFQNYMQKKHIN